MRKIITVSGKLRHGKDTLANMIIQYFYMHPNNRNSKTKAKKIAFADPIKKAAMIMFPQLTKEDLWGSSKNRDRIIEGYINPVTKKPLIVRDILTQIGKWGRDTNPDCWINAALFEAKELLKRDYGLIVFSDCRFRNEKSALEKEGSAVIRIVRPSIGFTTNDPSEIDLDEVTDFDYVVTNEDDDEDFSTLCRQTGHIVDNFIFSE